MFTYGTVYVIKSQQRMVPLKNPVERLFTSKIELNPMSISPPLVRIPSPELEFQSPYLPPKKQLNFNKLSTIVFPTIKMGHLQPATSLSCAVLMVD
jgi:hypothetical protein